MNEPFEEITGVISNSRSPAIRWRAGPEGGDVFGDDEDFDGFTLVVEVSGEEEARAMIAAIERI